MPIEIRELIIRATVSEHAESDARPELENTGKKRAELILECVEQVIEILKQKTER